MPLRKQLAIAAEEYRSLYLKQIERHRRMTPDDVHKAGQRWDDHQHRVARDAVIADRMKIDLPEPYDCPA